MAQTVDKLSRPLLQIYLDRYPAEFVYELESLSQQEVGKILSGLPLVGAVAVLERLSPGLAVTLMQTIKRNYALTLLNHMSPNRAAHLLASLDTASRQQYLDELEQAVSKDIETALSYPLDSAGSVMGTKIVYYSPNMPVKEALKKLKAQKKPGVRVLFLVDDAHVLQGMLEVQDLALAEKDQLLGNLMKPVLAYVEAMTSREEMVDIFEKHRVTEIPVVDFNGCLIGVVRHFTLINAAKEQSSVDMQTMVGVSKDERALSKASFAIRKRLPWLQINLATAFLAAAVVGFFEQTIAQVTALAVLLPVVAGQSGNTGAQALAVTMRGLALREVWPRQWGTLLRKEIGVGFWNGIAVALTTALGVYIWSQSVGLCLIIGISMVLSMIIASASGAMIPILLTKAGIDPATSSSIFLTTVTDVMGFLSFLGIATALMGMI